MECSAVMYRRFDLSENICLFVSVFAFVSPSGVNPYPEFRVIQRFYIEFHETKTKAIDISRITLRCLPTIEP